MPFQKTQCSYCAKHHQLPTIASDLFFPFKKK